MTCLITVTIIFLGQPFDVEREYKGRVVDIKPGIYKIDFTGANDWLKGVFEVPKTKCWKE